MRHRFVLWVVLGAAIFGAGVATPATAASFDCTKASTAVEKMICRDDGLNHLDDQMASYYKAQLRARPNDSSIREAQATWLQVRNRCPDEACLRSAYLDRLKVLMRDDQLAARSPANPDADLFKKYDALDGKCRGGSGDNPATMAACDERDRFSKELEARDWCYGPRSAPGYQKKWQKCLSEYEKSNWMHFQGSNGSRYFVDTNTRREQGGFRTIRYVVDNGAMLDWFQVAFDCNGRFQMMIPMGYQMRFFGPDSVMANISSVACY